jgi:hypothetical protein
VNISLIRYCAVLVLSSMNIVAIASVNVPDEIKAFIHSGTTLIDYQAADLNADGRQDAIIIIEKISENNIVANEPRIVIILLRKENGELETAELNDRAYLCKECLGSGFVNEQSITASKATFSVFNQGGSPRYRWTKEFTFQYYTRAKTWILAKVKTSVIDLDNKERFKTKSFVYPKSLKKISFSQFTPSANWDSKL